MKLNPYLHLNGRCREAFAFYAATFGGEITMMMTFGDSPMCADMPAAVHHRVMHAQLNIGDQVLMGADSHDETIETLNGFSVSLNVDNVAEAERLYAALSDGATIRMPLQPTFWSARFGMLMDRFGIPWMINCIVPSA